MMRTPKTLGVVLAALVALAGLSGCGEKTVTSYEPGKYSGARVISPCRARNRSYSGDSSDRSTAFAAQFPVFSAVRAIKRWPVLADIPDTGTAVPSRETAMINNNEAPSEPGSELSGSELRLLAAVWVLVCVALLATAALA